MPNETKQIFLDNQVSSFTVPVNIFHGEFLGKEYEWKGRYIVAGNTLNRYELWEVKK